MGKVYVFSNADEVELYKNGAFVTRLRRSKLSSLPHPPFVVDDTIGELLESQEGFPPAKAKLLRECLLAARDCGGIAGLSPAVKAKMLWCMARYGMKFQDGVVI